MDGSFASVVMALKGPTCLCVSGPVLWFLAVGVLYLLKYIMSINCYTPKQVTAYIYFSMDVVVLFLLWPGCM